MSELQKHHTVEIGSDRGFGYVFAAVFVLIAVVPMFFGSSFIWLAAVIGLAFLIVALTRPRLLHPLNVWWFKLGMALSMIVTPLVMLAVFVCAVLPTNLFMRIVGKDAMNRRQLPDAQSYWIARQEPVQSMRKQY